MSFCVRVSAEKGAQVSAMLSWGESSPRSIPLLVQPALLHRSLWSRAPRENKFSRFLPSRLGIVVPDGSCGSHTHSLTFPVMQPAMEAGPCTLHPDCTVQASSPTAVIYFLLAKHVGCVSTLPWLTSADQAWLTPSVFQYLESAPVCRKHCVFSQHSFRVRSSPVGIFLPLSSAFKHPCHYTGCTQITRHF